MTFLTGRSLQPTLHVKKGAGLPNMCSQRLVVEDQTSGSRKLKYDPINSDSSWFVVVFSVV